jgi:hypothetical protein
MTITEIKTIRKSDYEAYLQKGIGYDAYKQRMAEDLLYNTDLKTKEYVNLNQHRMSRVEKTYQVSAPLAQHAQRLTHKTYWLILTEHWCGDAAQTLPAFHKVAALSGGMLEMKLVYRDANPELMEAYLTGESRSIPKLIQLDAHYNVTGIWGPRPSEAQKLVKDLKSNPATAATYSTALHKWYSQNKQSALESEIGKLIHRASMFCPDCFN